ncbi:hypothetical protein GJ496_001791 [Pomphorhynchus laevis]|nr:hypothetical protein GJ496_001791 [Pomphorhynchus laevis]
MKQHRRNNKKKQHLGNSNNLSTYAVKPGLLGFDVFDQTSIYNQVSSNDVDIISCANNLRSNNPKLFSEAFDTLNINVKRWDNAAIENILPYWILFAQDHCCDPDNSLCNEIFHITAAIVQRSTVDALNQHKITLWFIYLIWCDGNADENIERSQEFVEFNDRLKQLEVGELVSQLEDFCINEILQLFDSINNAPQKSSANSFERLYRLKLVNKGLVCLLDYRYSIFKSSSSVDRSNIKSLCYNKSFIDALNSKSSEIRTHCAILLWKFLQHVGVYSLNDSEFDKFYSLTCIRVKKEENFNIYQTILRSFFSLVDLREQKTFDLNIFNAFLKRIASGFSLSTYLFDHITDYVRQSEFTSNDTLWCRYLDARLEGLLNQPRGTRPKVVSSLVESYCDISVKLITIYFCDDGYTKIVDNIFKALCNKHIPMEGFYQLISLQNCTTSSILYLSDLLSKHFLSFTENQCSQSAILLDDTKLDRLAQLCMHSADPLKSSIVNPLLQSLAKYLQLLITSEQLNDEYLNKIINHFEQRKMLPVYFIAFENLIYGNRLLKSLLNYMLQPFVTNTVDIDKDLYAFKLFAKVERAMQWKEIEIINDLKFKSLLQHVLASTDSSRYVDCLIREDYVFINILLKSNIPLNRIISKNNIDAIPDFSGLGYLINENKCFLPEFLAVISTDNDLIDCFCDRCTGISAANLSDEHCHILLEFLSDHIGNLKTDKLLKLWFGLLLQTRSHDIVFSELSKLVEHHLHNSTTLSNSEGPFMSLSYFLNACMHVTTSSSDVNSEGDELKQNSEYNTNQSRMDILYLYLDIVKPLVRSIFPTELSMPSCMMIDTNTVTSSFLLNVDNLLEPHNCIGISNFLLTLTEQMNSFVTDNADTTVHSMTANIENDNDGTIEQENNVKDRPRSLSTNSSSIYLALQTRIKHMFWLCCLISSWVFHRVSFSHSYQTSNICNYNIGNNVLKDRLESLYTSLIAPTIDQQQNGHSISFDDLFQLAYMQLEKGSAVFDPLVLRDRYSSLCIDPTSNIKPDSADIIISKKLYNKTFLDNRLKELDKQLLSDIGDYSNRRLRWPFQLMHYSRMMSCYLCQTSKISSPDSTESDSYLTCLTRSIALLRFFDEHFRSCMREEQNSGKFNSLSCVLNTIEEKCLKICSIILEQPQTYYATEQYKETATHFILESLCRLIELTGLADFFSRCQLDLFEQTAKSTVRCVNPVFVVSYFKSKLKNVNVECSLGNIIKYLLLKGLNSKIWPVSYASYKLIEIISHQINIFQLLDSSANVKATSTGESNDIDVRQLSISSYHSNDETNNPNISGDNDDYHCSLKQFGKQVKSIINFDTDKDDKFVDEDHRHEMTILRLEPFVACLNYLDELLSTTNVDDTTTEQMCIVPKYPNIVNKMLTLHLIFLTIRHTDIDVSAARVQKYLESNQVVKNAIKYISLMSTFLTTSTTKIDLRYMTTFERPVKIQITDTDLFALRDCLCLTMLNILPKAVRLNLALMDTTIKQTFHACLNNDICPKIIKSRFVDLRKCIKESSLPNCSVVPIPENSDLLVKIEINYSSVLTAHIAIPKTYPLEPINSLKFDSNVFQMSDIERWSCQFLRFASDQSCSWYDIVSEWQRNLTQKLNGFQECPICYYVLDRFGKFPQVPCSVCQKSYHVQCLSRWFSTSCTSRCPHCRSEI